MDQNRNESQYAMLLKSGVAIQGMVKHEVAQAAKKQEASDRKGRNACHWMVVLKETVTTELETPLLSLYS